MNASSPAAAELRLAITAQTLYLVNLLLLPGFTLLALWWLHAARAGAAGDFARAHLRQALVAGFSGSALLALAVLVFLLAGGPQRITAWVFAITYLVCVHATLVLLGVVALARAMAGRPYRYPLIGVR